MQYLILILLLLGNSQRTFADPGEGNAIFYKVEKDKSRSIKELLSQAKKLKGTKYKFGGLSAEEGMDCSGFVYHLYKKINISLPRSSALQATKGRKVMLKDSQPGDLLFFKRKDKVNHVAMVVKHVGNQLVIVHSTSSKGVIFEDLNSSAYWKNKVFVAKRLI